MFVVERENVARYFFQTKGEAIDFAMLSIEGGKVYEEIKVSYMDNIRKKRHGRVFNMIANFPSWE